MALESVYETRRDVPEGWAEKLKELVRKTITVSWPSENSVGGETSVPRFAEPKQLEQT